MDAVVNLCGLSTSNWPWTKRKKQRFLDSRIIPGRILATAIKNVSQPPKVFIQISGINHYGLTGEGIADESTPPASDYLAQLTVSWENSTKPVQEVGVRHVVCRTAVVLSRDALLLRLMALPAILYFGGRIGDGKQPMPWIHLADQIAAVRFLIENSDSEGAYNLISPDTTSNYDFTRTLSSILQRPYWFHLPERLIQVVLGEMSVLVTQGRYAKPKRLLDEGFGFRFANLNNALNDIFKMKQR